MMSEWLVQVNMLLVDRRPHSRAGFPLGPEQLSQSQQQYRTNLVRLSSTGELNPHSTLNRPSSARITVRAQVCCACAWTS